MKALSRWKEELWFLFPTERTKRTHIFNFGQFKFGYSHNNSLKVIFPITSIKSIFYYMNARKLCLELLRRDNPNLF